MPMALSRKEIPDSGTVKEPEREPEREVPMIWFGKRFGVPVILWAALVVSAMMFVILSFSDTKPKHGHEVGCSEIVQSPDGHTLKIDYVDGEKYVKEDPQCVVCRQDLDRHIRQVVAFAFDSLVVQVTDPNY